MSESLQANPLNCGAELAIEPERAQRGLIGYPSVDRARPVNLRVGRLSLTNDSPHDFISSHDPLEACLSHLLDFGYVPRDNRGAL